jgi:hypothetical protein
MEIGTLYWNSFGVYAASRLLIGDIYMTKDCMLSVINGWKIQWKNK